MGTGIAQTPDVSSQALAFPAILPLDITLNGGQAEVTGAAGTLTVTISGFPLYDGTYTVTSPELATGPVMFVAPEITGTGEVDTVLGVQAGLWVYVDTGLPPVVSYEWLRDGVPISGATGETYTVVPADSGSDLSLRETVNDAHNTHSHTSVPVIIPAASAALSIALQDEASIGTLNNTTHIEPAMVSVDGSHHIIAIYLRDDTNSGPPTGVSFGGVACSLMSDGTTDVTVSNAGRRKFALYQTQAPVNGMTADLNFTVPSYYSGFQTYVMSISAQADVFDLEFNATAGQNPLQLDVDTVADGAVIIAGLFNGIPTTVTPQNFTTLSSPAAQIQGQNLVLGTQPTALAESPLHISLAHDLVAQLSFVSIALRATS